MTADTSLSVSSSFLKFLEVTDVSLCVKSEAFSGFHTSEGCFWVQCLSVFCIIHRLRIDFCFSSLHFCLIDFPFHPPPGLPLIFLPSGTSVCGFFSVCTVLCVSQSCVCVLMCKASMRAALRNVPGRPSCVCRRDKTAAGY